MRRKPLQWADRERIVCHLKTSLLGIFILMRSVNGSQCVDCICWNNHPPPHTHLAWIWSHLALHSGFRTYWDSRRNVSNLPREVQNKARTGKAHAPQTLTARKIWPFRYDDPFLPVCEDENMIVIVGISDAAAPPKRSRHIFTKPSNGIGGADCSGGLILAIVLDHNAANQCGGHTRSLFRCNGSKGWENVQKIMLLHPVLRS